MQDSKSIVSSETCALLELIAEQLGRQFQDLAGQVVTKKGLLAAVSSANQELSVRADSCLTRVLELCESDRYLPVLFEDFGKQRQEARVKISRYLITILRSFSLASLKPNLQLIEAQLLSEIADNSQEVRTNGCAAF